MFESYNPYNPYNSYYNQVSQQMPRQPVQTYKPQTSLVLQGKVVDSLEVVKATDIPYDGSISYFPLTDGSAIVTKQLQQDGTSKIIIYKPISEKEKEKDTVNYVTTDDLEKQLQDINKDYITEKDFKEQIKNIHNKDIKDMKEDIKTLKRKLEDVIDDLKDKKER